MKTVNQHLRDSLLVTALSVIWGAIVAWVLSFMLPMEIQPTWKIYPIWTNIIEALTMVFGDWAGVITAEDWLDRNIYKENQLAIGMGILSLIGPLTLGLAVPPFNLSPFPVAVAGTVGLEILIFNLALTLPKIRP